jgi:hypothetical protein
VTVGICVYIKIEMLKLKKFFYLEWDAFDHIKLEVLSVKLYLVLAFAFLEFIGSRFRFILAKVNHFDEYALTSIENLFRVVKKF